MTAAKLQFFLQTPITQIVKNEDSLFNHHNQRSFGRRPIENELGM